MDHNNTKAPQSAQDIYNRVREEFSLNDTIQLLTDEGEDEIVVIRKFYPHLVQVQRMNGKLSTMRYFELKNARLVRASGFQVCNSKMRQNAFLKSLDGKKVGQ